MVTNLIRDRGRGPEIEGTRLTVYNLLPHFLDPTATEGYICRLYELSPEQVAAARAFVLNNVDTVLVEHLKIEARIAAGNSAQVIEQGNETHATFLRFRHWLAERDRSAPEESTGGSEPGSRRVVSATFPTFRQWLAERESRPAERP